jgi:serralysin
MFVRSIELGRYAFAFLWLLLGLVFGPRLVAAASEQSTSLAVLGVDAADVPLPRRALEPVHTSRPVIPCFTSVSPPQTITHASQSHLWKAGSELRIGFLDGTAGQKARVQRIASTWTRYANIRLTFVDLASQRSLASNLGWISPTLAVARAAVDGWTGVAPKIRISFQSAGNYSAIGTDAGSIRTSEATMNLGIWRDVEAELAELKRKGAKVTPEFADEYRNESIHRMVLHELGHMLGLVHEHQAPGNGIRWNKRVVAQAMREKRGEVATEEWLDDNIFHPLDKETLCNGSTYDRTSIMHYPIPANWTMDGVEVPINRNLSDEDQKFIAICYPKRW